jgi:predicted O-methyltransferase YrrM
MPILRKCAVQEEAFMLAVEKHEQALASYRCGHFADAVGLLGQALQEEESSERWNDWASAQLLNRRPAEAEIGYRRALQLDAENPQTSANLGALLASCGRHSEALPYLEKSEPRISEAERGVVQKLVAECRRALSARDSGGETTSLPPVHIQRALALQTSALNQIALRLLAIENQLANGGHGQPAKAPVAGIKETDVIPKAAMSEIFSAATEIRLLAPAPGIPSVSLPELCLLIHLLVRSRARTIFEIGTYVGRTTLNLALNSRKEARIYTLDFPRGTHDGYAPGSLFQRTPLKKKITQLYGESSSFDFSEYFGTVDFVFIDASHTYEHALSDSRNALEMLRSGRGTIAWHDYGWQGVAPALNKLFREDKRLSGMRHIEGTSLVFADIGPKPRIPKRR